MTQLSQTLKEKLVSNLFAWFGAGIGDLKQLQALEVSHNRLRWLPPQLSHCANLCQLCVDSNQLVTLPRQLCSLTQLLEISACDNCLVSLPQGKWFAGCDLSQLILPPKAPVWQQMQHGEVSKISWENKLCVFVHCVCACVCVCVCVLMGGGRGVDCS